ncbi:MAG: hypothetical protein AAB791_00785 [Patescibacteria group bacterium]
MPVPQIYRKPSKTARWLVDRGIVRTERQANYVLIAITIVFVAVSIFLFFKDNLKRTGVEINTNPGIKETYIPS